MLDGKKSKSQPRSIFHTLITSCQHTTYFPYTCRSVKNDKRKEEDLKRHIEDSWKESHYPDGDTPVSWKTHLLPQNYGPEAPPLTAASSRHGLSIRCRPLPLSPPSHLIVYHLWTKVQKLTLCEVSIYRK